MLCTVWKRCIKWFFRYTFPTYRYTRLAHDGGVEKARGAFETFTHGNKLVAKHARLAQLVEQLVYTEKVRSSSLLPRTCKNRLRPVFLYASAR